MAGVGSDLFNSGFISTSAPAPAPVSQWTWISGAPARATGAGVSPPFQPLSDSPHSSAHSPVLPHAVPPRPVSYSAPVSVLSEDEQQGETPLNDRHLSQTPSQRLEEESEGEEAPRTASPPYEFTPSASPDPLLDDDDAWRAVMEPYALDRDILILVGREGTRRARVLDKIRAAAFSSGIAVLDAQQAAEQISHGGTTPGLLILDSGDADQPVVISLAAAPGRHSIGMVIVADRMGEYELPGYLNPTAFLRV